MTFRSTLVLVTNWLFTKNTPHSMCMHMWNIEPSYRQEIVVLFSGQSFLHHGSIFSPFWCLCLYLLYLLQETQSLRCQNERFLCGDFCAENCRQDNNSRTSDIGVVWGTTNKGSTCGTSIKPNP